MNQTTVSFRMDSNDKKLFEEFCDEVGMNITTALNMFVKNVIKEQKLPFEVRADYTDEEMFYQIAEAERKYIANPKRYTSDEILERVKKIIDEEL